MSWKTKIVRTIDVPLHIYNRGANRETIFFCDSDFQRFLRILTDCLVGSGVSLLAYALLPNHFHLILQQTHEYAVSNYMQRVCWQYSRYLNRSRKRSGHLFEGRFKPSRIVDEESLLRLSHYIHGNPVAAGLAPSPEEWKYSSARIYKDDVLHTGLVTDPILSLVHGQQNYARFMDEYDPSQPDTLCLFLGREDNVPEKTRRTVTPMEESK